MCSEIPRMTHMCFWWSFCATRRGLCEGEAASCLTAVSISCDTFPGKVEEAIESQPFSAKCLYYVRHLQFIFERKYTTGWSLLLARKWCHNEGWTWCFKEGVLQLHSISTWQGIPLLQGWTWHFKECVLLLQCTSTWQGIPWKDMIFHIGWSVWLSRSWLMSAPKIATWLILPVVIRSSQRLSHACLSINLLLWNCERLIISVIIYLIIPYYLDNRSNSRANTCVNTLLG